MKIECIQYGQTSLGLPANANIIRQGYTFNGWYKTFPGWDATPMKITSSTRWDWKHDITAQAEWTAKSCNVTWDANGGKWTDGKIKKVTSTKVGTILGVVPLKNLLNSEPASDGFEFMGWFTQPTYGTQVYEYTTVERNTTYYAHWKEKYCTITFKDENDKEIETFSVKYGYVLTFPKRSKKGYDFDGWIDVDDVTKKYSIDDTLFVVDDVTFKESFVPKEYTITYEWEGEIPDAWWTTYTIESLGSEGYTLPGPELPGYKFNGWNFNGTKVDTIPPKSTGNRTFVSRGWTPKEYTITFDSCGGIPLKPITIHYDEKISLPKDPVKPESEGERYEFLGWYTEESGGDKITNGTPYPTDGDSTYYAHWKTIIIKYEIEYVGNGSTFGHMENSIHKNGVKKPLTKNAYAKEYTITYVDIKATPGEDSWESKSLKFLGWAETSSEDVKYQDQ